LHRKSNLIMALRYAVVSGNWSSNSTWNGTSSVPAAGDTVVANGFTVTIDASITLSGGSTISAGSFVVGQWYQIVVVGTTSFTSIGASANTVGIYFQATGVGSGTGTATAIGTIQTLAGGSGVAGGSFSITGSSIGVTADVRSGSSTCLTVASTATSPSITAISGIYGGSTNTTQAVLNNMTSGTLTITGAITGGTGNSAYGINNSSGGTVNITTSGSGITGGGISGGTDGGVYNASTGSIMVSGPVNGGSNIGGTLFYYGAGIHNAGAGSITITGAITAFNACGFYNAAAGNIILIGSITASTSANGVLSQTTAATIKISGSTYDASNGITALNVAKYYLNTSVTGGVRRVSLDGSSTFQNFYTADSTNTASFAMPAVTDVRSGVTYAGTGSSGGSQLVGTCAVPAAGSVALGVSVSQTTGTAVLTASAVQSAVIPLL
jgi:hypothetical protein